MRRRAPHRDLHRATPRSLSSAIRGCRSAARPSARRTPGSSATSRASSPRSPRPARVWASAGRSPRRRSGWPGGSSRWTSGPGRSSSSIPRSGGAATRPCRYGTIASACPTASCGSAATARSRSGSATPRSGCASGRACRSTCPSWCNTRSITSTASSWSTARTAPAPCSRWRAAPSWSTLRGRRTGSRSPGSPRRRAVSTRCSWARRSSPARRCRIARAAPSP